MSKRETKLMSIFFRNNKEMFTTYEEIEKVAEALKEKVEYIRRHKKDCFVNVFIGLSHLNIRYGYYEYLDNKKPGKNKLVKRPKPRKNSHILVDEPWHLHILIEANPGETIGEEIADYLNKKFKTDIAYKHRITKGFFPYAMKQCRYMRYVRENRQTDLVQYNFKEIYEKKYKPLTKGKLAGMKKAAKKEGKKFRKSEKNFQQIINNKGNDNGTKWLQTIY